MIGQFDICIVAQRGRLAYEAVLFAVSLRQAAPDFAGRLIVGEPQPGPLWPKDPRLPDDVRAILSDLGATILPFDAKHFGATYPQGNKVELLQAMAPNEPFVFFDTDTLITGRIDNINFDFDHPSASMARENTWPIVPLYGPELETIWRAVFDRAGVDIIPTLDTSHPADDWQRYLYFNAGWFFAPCPQDFANRMIALMIDLRDNTPAELACQSLDPWLDQIALPVVIADLNGGRPGPQLDGLDGAASLHWRTMSLLYAKAPDGTIAFLEDVARPNKIKKILKQYEPFKRMIYQSRGEKVRALFDQAHLPTNEKTIRNRIKRAKLWMR
ncbi:MAG: hypothetical protein AAF222_15215 [Pseudomonadota bacterium]